MKCDVSPLHRKALTMKNIFKVLPLLVLSLKAHALGYTLSATEKVFLYMIILWPITLAVPLTFITLYRFLKKKSYKPLLMIAIFLYILGFLMLNFYYQ